MNLIFFGIIVFISCIVELITQYIFNTRRNLSIFSIGLNTLIGVLVLIYYRYMLAFFGFRPSICSEMVGDFSECNMPADEQIFYGLGSMIVIILILGIQFKIHKK